MGRALIALGARAPSGQHGRAAADEEGAPVREPRALVDDRAVRGAHAVEVADLGPHARLLEGHAVADCLAVATAGPHVLALHDAAPARVAASEPGVMRRLARRWVVGGQARGPLVRVVA